jgi:hypothetical protein
MGCGRRSCSSFEWISSFVQPLPTSSEKHPYAENRTKVLKLLDQAHLADELAAESVRRSRNEDIDRVSRCDSVDRKRPPNAAELLDGPGGQSRWGASAVR